jgi:cell division protein FtsI/penicillin-binding protein 2
MSTELRRARNRQMVIFLLVCVGLLVLSGHLYYWQVVDSPVLAKMAEDEHTQVQTVNAPRGQIYDAQGMLLATNIVRDDVYVEPAQIVTDYPDSYQDERNQLAQQLHQVLTDIPVATLQKALDSNLPTQRIAIKITTDQSQKLRNLHLPYIFLEPRPWRDYPNGDLASQILGYVQSNREDEAPYGVYGIEQQYNTELTGKAGSFTAETDLNGNPLTVGASSTQPAVNGSDLTLTIDEFIQYEVQTALEQRVKEMNAVSGSAVVLNARTGAVVAMAGYPSFDPNNYSQYADQRGCRGALSVYFNPVMYCAYEPGSTMKAVTMAAALDQKVVTPDTTLDDAGHLDFTDGTPSVYNWHKLAYGTETMTQVLQHSANVGAAWVATSRLGAKKFYPYLKNFDFGQRTGLFGPEASGSYNAPQDVAWSPSDLAREAFGQSISVTPLQMARVYQAVANDGTLMKPYLVSSIKGPDHTTTIQPQIERQVISETAAHELVNMLVQTAQYEHISVPGYQVAIKTGTATNQSLADTNTDASMAGFIPASNPQFVILVKLDRPQASIYGGTAAGPLWEKIAQQLMWHYGIPPDDTSS